MKNNNNKLNWNGLTENQQCFVEKLVNNEVLTLANELIQSVSTNNDYIEIYNEYDEETDNYKEIFCYFIISKYLYDQLNNINACIFEYKGLYFWGRTDFGQSLEMNHELKQIASNLIKD